jgi:hypothetical protein
MTGYAGTLLGIAVAAAASSAQAGINVVDCGTNYAVTRGSSPYAGSMKPGTNGSNMCRLEWSPSPFTRGSWPDFVSPVCTIDWKTREVETSLAVTANGFQLTYRNTTPTLITWKCAYPS